MFGVNPKFIAEEVSKRKEECINNVEVIEIAKQCEKEQVLVFYLLFRRKASYFPGIMRVLASV
jgi:hypothetical protein